MDYQIWEVLHAFSLVAQTQKDKDFEDRGSLFSSDNLASIACFSSEFTEVNQIRKFFDHFPPGFIHG